MRPSATAELPMCLMIPRLKVWTAFDLGIDDSTAIWCCQISRGGEWRLIDYIEDSGAGLDHYVRLLQQRPYVYERHLLPHDAEVRELGSGKSRTETLHGLGVKPTRGVRAAQRRRWHQRRAHDPAALLVRCRALRQRHPRAATLPAGVERGRADLAFGSGA